MFAPAHVCMGAYVCARLRASTSLRAFAYFTIYAYSGAFSSCLHLLSQAGGRWVNPEGGSIGE